METEPKTVEQKLKALQSLFNAVSQTEPQKIIEEIQLLASSKEMNDFIQTNTTLPSQYTYSDFLDEIFRCLSNIQILQYNFTMKMKTLFWKQNRVFESHWYTFEPWVTSCFINKDMDFIQIIELCGILFTNGHQIPFSFVSTQIIRLFYSPNSLCIYFLEEISSKSIEHLLKRFSEKPDPETQKYIIHLASLILSDQNIITLFNETNNSMGPKNYSKEKTQERLQDIIDNLTFHLLPQGYQPYAHTDYQKNIYLSCDCMPKNKMEFQRTLMSVISLTHAVGYARQIESAFFDCPLDFAPEYLRYEAEPSIEEQVFGLVISLDDVKSIDAEGILRDPNIDSNFVDNLKAAFSKFKSDVAAGRRQRKIVDHPKD